MDARKCALRVAARRSNSIGSAGSTGWLARSSAFRNCATSLSACLMSSMRAAFRSANRRRPAQIHGAAAAGAIHGADVLPQLVDLLRRERPDEVFSRRKSKKVMSRPWPFGQFSTRTASSAACPAFVAVALAAGTLRELGVTVLRTRQLLADDAKERQRRPGVSDTLSRASNQKH